MSSRALLNRLKIALGRNPAIQKNKGRQGFIPSRYKAVLLVSADFELAWAWQFAKACGGNLSHALKKASRERANIPIIVDLCAEYSLPVTWAAVGHLFLESCRRNGEAHQGHARPPFLENEYWRYSVGDWFQNDPCSNYKDEPGWYAPDLLKLILGSKVKHEIGCHTFSHIDCRDSVCPPDLLRAELALCRELARRWGIELRSFVHPGHMIGNLDVIAEQGFTNFRTDFRNVLGYPKKHGNGLWELEQTAEIAYRKEWPTAYHVSRYITILKRAMKSNTVCVLWFHPSFDPILIEKVLPELFRFIGGNRDKLWVTTHGEYVDWLNSR